MHSDLLPGFSGFTAEELLFGIPSGQFIQPLPQGRIKLHPLSPQRTRGKINDRDFRI